MFCCDKCATKNKGRPADWFAAIAFRSVGPCESCGKIARCYEVSLAPLRPEPKENADRVSPT